MDGRFGGPARAHDMALLGALDDTKIMAILRGKEGRCVLETARTLIDAGIRCVEITATTPGAFESATRLAGLPGACIGIGTVTSPDEVQRAVQAGVDFIVSPHTDRHLVCAAIELGLAAVPGALSPTEVATAMSAGATAVKIFPAATVGPGYLKALQGPFPDVKAVATGGITPGSMREWLAAGAAGAGVGSPLIADALEGGSQSALRERALEFLHVSKVRP